MELKKKGKEQHMQLWKRKNSYLLAASRTPGSRFSLESLEKNTHLESGKNNLAKMLSSLKTSRVSLHTIKAAKHFHHRWELLEHLPYIPDLSPVSPLRKKNLGGRVFRTSVEIQKAILACLQDLGSDFSYTGYHTLVYRWDKCFDNHVDYVAK
ncbi:hypothetical protein AVEN_154923-1 [Araneus ventricosus]|uniref:Uncharacterized protein n=1 Tax=Araneus ventricosus TaxID=182803 RepID=A0A4Y2A8E6_ARAVE|nr:hypothetical protein AVEN_154923-1 [Araneus ventricosus]